MIIKQSRKWILLLFTLTLLVGEKKCILITLAGYFKLVALWKEMLPRLYPLEN